MPELLFVLLLVAALVGVVFLGSLSYAEAQRTEMAKSHAQTVIEVLRALGPGGNVPASLREPCRLREGPAGAGSSWAACRAGLVAPGGPLAGLPNPFDARQAFFAAQCDRTNLATRGAIVVEKGYAPVPGAPVAYGPLEDGEVLARGLLLRVLACDKGAFSIRVGELKL